MLRSGLRLAALAALALLPSFPADAGALPATVLEAVTTIHDASADPVDGVRDGTEQMRFAGVNFGEQPNLVVTAMHRLIPSGAPRETVARSGCTTPVCAADAVFGAGIGARLIRLYVVYGFNGSHLGRPGVKPWSVGELDSILGALADAPLDTPREERLLLRDDRLDRFRGTLAIAAPAGTDLVAINGAGDIGLRFGATWAAMTPAQQRAAALHELAHELARTRGRAEGWSAMWSEAALADAFLARRAGLQTSRVSRYAMTSLAEDFAESVVAYRYAPQLLKQRAPNRLRILREIVFRETPPVAVAATQSAQAASSM